MLSRPLDRAAVIAGLLLAGLSIVVGAFIRVHAVPASAHYFSEDQQVYLAMARAPFSHVPQVRHAPGSWRVLPPLLAGAIGSFGGGPGRGVLILMFATFGPLPIAAPAWCEALHVSPPSAK